MKEPYKLPEDQRERVTRTEMHALQWLLNDISSMSYAQEDLAKRLECVPAGMQRIRLATGQLRSVLRHNPGEAAQAGSRTPRTIWRSGLYRS